MTTQAPTKDVIIGKYVQLRDEIAAISERHAAELAPLNDQMQRIEAYLLASLNQDGVDSYKTSAGTAYKSTTTSTRMDNKEEFLRCALADVAVTTKTRVDVVVQKVMECPLLDIRVAKKGVQEFVETTGYGVPGVNIEQMVKVNIRRS